MRAARRFDGLVLIMIIVECITGEACDNLMLAAGRLDSSLMECSFFCYKLVQWTFLEVSYREREAALAS
jgi:hypothetical protein